MRTWIASLSFGVLCTVGLGTATAAEGKREPAGPRFDAARFIKDFDKNGDGQLSKDEVPADLREHFAAIDKDKDGKISKAELERYAKHVAGRRPRAVEMVYVVVEAPEEESLSVAELQEAYDLLRKLDKDKDGKISKDEVAAFRQQRMKHRIDTIIKDLDKNKDGKISKAEARGLLADDFDKIDTNKDGSIDREELQKALTPPREGGKGSGAGR